MDTRMGWIDSEAELSLVKQCELAGVSRATWYNRHSAKPASDDDLQVCRLIDCCLHVVVDASSWHSTKRDKRARVCIE